MHERLKTRIKSLHEEADRIAKREMVEEKREARDRKIGTMEIDGIAHHENLKDWSKSANNWNEMKSMMKIIGQSSL